MLDHAKTYYDNLTNQAGKTAVAKWTVDIERAELNRKKDVTCMDIYAAKLAETVSDTPAPVPGTRDSPSTSWMELSLTIEEKQYVVCSFILLLFI